MDARRDSSAGARLGSLGKEDGADGTVLRLLRARNTREKDETGQGGIAPAVTGKRELSCREEKRTDRRGRTRVDLSAFYSSPGAGVNRKVLWRYSVPFSARAKPRAG
jgi:hypothetical protein